jgi:hypothetical protein
MRLGTYKARVSYGELRVGSPPLPADIARFEAVSNQMNIAGANRTTSPDRFHALNPWLLEGIRGAFDRDAHLIVHEWAASDCCAAARWAIQVFEVFPNADFVASDIVLFLVECRNAEGESFIFDARGSPLQYVKPPVVVRLQPPERIVFPVNWLVARYARRKLQSVQPFARLPREWLDGDDPDCADYRDSEFEYSKISLVHPDAAELAKIDRRFSIRAHSVFTPLAEPVDIIRALNIFNPVYFDRQKLSSGIGAAWHSLHPQGVLITGRTTESGEHRVCVLRKTSGGFELIGRLGTVSEIEPLALQFRR